MSPHSGGTYRQSDQGLTVAARTLPGGAGRTYLCMSGEMDMAASAVLSNTVDWLAASAPTTVLIDLADITFAGSTLPNFVARVRHAVPDDAELIIWRARPATQWVLRVTGMATIATIRNEPTDPLAVLN